MSQTSSSKNPLIIVLALLLLASVGGNIFQFFHTREVIVQRDLEIVKTDSIAKRKAELDKEYNDAIEELNQFKGQSEQLDSLLKEANLKIEEQRKKIAKLIDQNQDYQVLKQRMDEMRKEKEFYLKEIARLQEENNLLKSQNTELLVKVDQTTSENKTLKGKVETASKLQVISISPKPVNTTAGGKEKDTDKAKKTDQLNISFTIGENPLATNGDHTVYLRVFNPEGFILSDGSVKKFTSESGSEIPYSRSIQINYDGSKISKVITWKQDVFSAGVYKIEIYIDGYLAGTEKLTLY